MGGLFDEFVGVFGAVFGVRLEMFGARKVFGENVSALALDVMVHGVRMNVLMLRAFGWMGVLREAFVRALILREALKEPALKEQKDVGASKEERASVVEANMVETHTRVEERALYPITIAQQAAK